MTDDSTAPATKQDISLLMEEMGKLDVKITIWKEEIIHEFHIVAENIRHDSLGANRDEVDLLKNRVRKIEKHVGLAV